MSLIFRHYSSPRMIVHGDFLLIGGATKSWNAGLTLPLHCSAPASPAQLPATDPKVPPVHKERIMTIHFPAQSDRSAPISVKGSAPASLEHQVNRLPRPSFLDVRIDMRARQALYLATACDEFLAFEGRPNHRVRFQRSSKEVERALLAIQRELQVHRKGFELVFPSKHEFPEILKRYVRANRKPSALLAFYIIH
jgi:hypothetical protein